MVAMVEQVRSRFGELPWPFIDAKGRDVPRMRVGDVASLVVRAEYAGHMLGRAASGGDTIGFRLFEYWFTLTATEAAAFPPSPPKSRPNGTSSRRHGRG